MCIDLQQAVQLNNDGVNALVNDNEDAAIAFMADSLKVLQNDMSQTEESPTSDPTTTSSCRNHVQQYQRAADCSSSPTESPSPPSSHKTTATDPPSSPRSTLDDLAQNPFIRLSKRHHMFLQQQQQHQQNGIQHRQRQQQNHDQQPPSSVQQQQSQQSPGNPCILLFERAVLIPQASPSGSSTDGSDASSLAVVQLKDVLVSTVCVLFNVALAHHRKGKKLLGNQQRQECQSQQGAEQEPQDLDSCSSSDTDDTMDEDGDASVDSDTADDCISKAEKLYRVVLGTDLLATATISSQTTTSTSVSDPNSSNPHTNTTCLLNNMHNTAIALIVKLACINNLLEIRPDRGMHDLAFEGLVTDVITLLQTSRVVADHPLFQNPQIQYLLLNVFLLQEFGPHIAPGAA